MSYLNALRLHFSGQFQANVSTVNNDPGHFDNAAFLPSYQDMQGPNMQPPNGWFNPQGDAAFTPAGMHDHDGLDTVRAGRVVRSGARLYHRRFR
jgi:hypothetical protein